MDRISHRRNIYKNMNRHPLVSAVKVDTRGVWARVYHPDQQVVSGWLAVMQGNVRKGGTNDFYMPQEGEQVLTIYFGSGVQEGVVLGGLYDELNPPPLQDRKQRHIKFADGTIVNYDVGQKVLTVSAQGKIGISCLDKCTVSVGSDCTITVVGNATISASTVTIKAPTTIQGNTTIQGDASITGNLTVQGQTTQVQNLVIQGSETGGGEI